MSEELTKHAEEILRTIRYHNHILLDDNLKEHHHDSQVCLDILNPIYHDVKRVIQGFDTITREE